MDMQLQKGNQGMEAGTMSSEDKEEHNMPGCSKRRELCLNMGTEFSTKGTNP